VSIRIEIRRFVPLDRKSEKGYLKFIGDVRGMD
jgi:hypothetical protein